MTPDPAPVASRARATLAALAAAARSGALTSAAALAYTAQLHRDLNVLAEYEEAMDDMTEFHREQERAARAAIAAGSVAVFPRRRIGA